MKKYIKYTLPALFALTVLPAAAQQLGSPDEPFTMSSMIDGMGNTLLFIILGISLIMLLMVTFVYFAVLRLRNKVLSDNDPSYAAHVPQSTLGLIFQVNPITTDNERMLDHQYDDIQELNNPIPGWFMALFYGTVAFGVIYWLNYHVLDSGKLQNEEYVVQMEKAKLDYEAYLKTAGDKINAETVTLLTDKDVIAKGQELFAKSCVACHGKLAEGTSIAPNLTDEYWIHGGGVKNVFKTITDGVELKGMKSWKKDFSPVQIQQIASYVLSLQGSKPANAKEPQGEKWMNGQVAPSAPADSTAKDTAGPTLTSMR
ncbi:MAG: cbb3-type cytochrome c oxidase N-terminal domain-containing protein [Bacteroidota bacterium]